MHISLEFAQFRFTVLVFCLTPRFPSPECRFFELFAKYDGYKDGHIKLKKPKQLQEVLDIARALLAEIEQNRADPETEEKKGKLEQLKSVLEM